MSAAVAERRARVGEVVTRVLSVEGDGPVLLLLHGWAESADSWRRVLDRAAREGRAAIAADLPGFGGASTLGDGPVLPQLERFCDALVDEVAGEEGVVLVGHSVSGAVALRVAAHRSDDLAGLVLVAPLGSERPWWQALAARDAIALPSLLKLPLPVPMTVARPIAAQLFRRGGFADPAGIDQEVVETYLSHYGDSRSLTRAVEVALRLLREAEPPPDLSGTALPALLVWGREDRIVSFDRSRAVRAAVPHARVEVIAGAGHVPHLEKPERAADLLLGFPAGDDLKRARRS